MRIVLMGTPNFAVPSLEALIQGGYEVAGVFTQPDRPSGRGNRIQMSPVKEAALKHGIPVFQPVKIRRDGVEDLRNLLPAPQTPRKRAHQLGNHERGRGDRGHHHDDQRGH